MTRLTRSQLYVPASKPAMIQKAAASAADAVCIDLEDSVTPAEKASSRANVIHALKEIDRAAMATAGSDSRALTLRIAPSSLASLLLTAA